MTYVNNLTFEQIHDMLTSISNSLYQLKKKHQTCFVSAEVVDAAYKSSIVLDDAISSCILRHDKKCDVS